MDGHTVPLSTWSNQLNFHNTGRRNDMRTVCSKRHHIPKWDCPPLSFLLEGGIQWKRVWPMVSSKGWHWFLHMYIEKSLVVMVHICFQVYVVIEHLYLQLTWTWHLKWQQSNKQALLNCFQFHVNFQILHVSHFYICDFSHTCGTRSWTAV